MLNRSKAAKFAKSVFFQIFNDFDIYVEDTAQGYTKLYANLLSRAMSNNVALSRVYPIGSRVEVIEQAKKKISQSQNDNNGRKSVFIVDGDLYLLCGEKTPLPANVVSLPKYCVENFLIDEEAIVAFMDEEEPTKSAEQLRNELDFSGWLNRAKSSLTKLFVIFSIAHKYQTGIPTVSLGYQAVCAGADGEVDTKKVDVLSDSIKQQLVKLYGAETIDKEIEKTVSTINWDECFVRKYVSAKDFSLPLMIVRIKAITKSKAPHINVKLRFSKTCDITPLKDLVEKISLSINMPEIVIKEGEV